MERFYKLPTYLLLQYTILYRTGGQWLITVRNTKKKPVSCYKIISRKSFYFLLLDLGQRIALKIIETVSRTERTNAHLYQRFHRTQKKRRQLDTYKTTELWFLMKWTSIAIAHHFWGPDILRVKTQGIINGFYWKIIYSSVQ